MEQSQAPPPWDGKERRRAPDRRHLAQQLPRRTVAMVLAGGRGSRLHDLTERLVKLEGHADILHEAGLKALYNQARQGNPMDFVVGNEIYSHLEKVTDRFEDVANEISGLVIDHA